MTDKLTVNEELLSKFYGSFFEGQAKYSMKSNSDTTGLTKNISNFSATTNKYKNIYFPENEVSAKVNYNDGIKANDFAGTLSFEIHLHYDSGTNNDVDGKTRIFTVSTKNITDFIETHKKETNNLKVKRGGNLGEAIQKQLQNEIDSLISKQGGFTDNTSKTISGLNDILKKWTNLFNLDNNVSNYDKNDWESLSIFGFKIDGDAFGNIGDVFNRVKATAFDTNSGLFGGYGNRDSAVIDVFQIRSITFDFGDTTNISVKKDDASSQTATISFQAKMKLLVGNELIEQKSTFELSVNKLAVTEPKTK